MRRKLVVVASLAAAVTVVLGSLVASANPVDEHDPELPKHPHVLVLGVVVDAEDNPVSIKKCVDLAANRALPLNAHHVHVHFGQAGEALAAKGNFVVPTAPFPGVPWSDCDSLLKFFGF